MYTYQILLNKVPVVFLDKPNSFTDVILAFDCAAMLDEFDKEKGVQSRHVVQNTTIGVILTRGNHPLAIKSHSIDGTAEDVDFAPLDAYTNLETAVRFIEEGQVYSNLGSLGKCYDVVDADTGELLHRTFYSPTKFNPD